MSDETATNSNGTSEQSAAATQQDQPNTPPAKTYTQAEVDAMVAKHHADFAAVRKALTKDKETAPKGKQTDKQKDESVSTPDIDARLRRLDQKEALNDFFAENVSIPKEKRSLAKQLIEDADPSDPAAWVESRLKPLLATDAPPPSTQTVNNAASAPAAAQAATVEQHKPPTHPQSDAGAPQSLPVWERPSDPFKWTAEDIARLEAQKGVRAAAKIIRQKAEEAAQRMTFKLPGRGRPNG